MNLQKLTPWNWFKNEQQGKQPPQGANYPAQRPGDGAQRMDSYQQMRQLFDEMASQFTSSFSSNRGVSTETGGFGVPAGFMRPNIDIRENDSYYTITADLPGVERDDIEVATADNTLIIRGEKPQERETDSGEFHVIERSYGSFQRVLDLPEDSDTDDMTAQFNNGVLTLKVGRKNEQRSPARRIEIS